VTDGLHTRILFYAVFLTRSNSLCYKQACYTLVSNIKPEKLLQGQKPVAFALHVSVFDAPPCFS
jgi:hypothetical protein